MRSKQRTLSLILLLLAAGGQRISAGPLVPFRGSDVGRFVVNPTTDPSVVFTEDFTTGHATHLGKYTLVAHEFVNLATLEITGGAFTITAADGSMIEGTYSGTASLTATEGVITYVVTGPISGGTGRFTGATGMLTFSGVADLRTGGLSETITGEISSTGSLP